MNHSVIRNFRITASDRKNFQNDGINIFLKIVVYQELLVKI